MKKLNNKGFLLAESLVVSTFVLTVLIFLFIQFQNLMVTYRESYNYNSVESIYNLGSMENYLAKAENRNNSLKSQLQNSSVPYLVVYSSTGETGSCNVNLGLADMVSEGSTFCEGLANMMGLKTLIYTDSDISIIQAYVDTNEDSVFSESMRNFIKRVSATPVDGKARLIGEFNDGTYATIAVDTDIEIVPVNMNGVYVTLVSTGDGLYKDSYETGRYVYKGTNPNNYIMFNGEVWRIISIESDGTLKIVRNDVLPVMPFDQTRPANWAGPADLNVYLNGTYFNNLSAIAQSQIIDHDFNIGAVTVDDNMDKLINNENAVTWNGKVGLMNVSDYLMANTNIRECGTISLNNANNAVCLGTNYLFNSNGYWTITADGKANYNVFMLYDSGVITGDVIDGVGASVRPVVYLSTSVKLVGSGTASDPYVME